MRSRASIVAVLVVLGLASPVRAQSGEPYLLAHAGVSLGDGGTAPAAAFGLGYLTPRRVGFEIEVGFVPGLDFGDPGFPRIAASYPQIFPPIRLESSGRIVSLHTNGVVILPGVSRNLRAYIVAGGGVADVKQDVRVALPMPLGPRPLPVEIATSDLEVSDTALSLTAGAGLEFLIGRRLTLGGDVRYQHVFSDPRELDLARAGVKLGWRF